MVHGIQVILFRCHFKPRFYSRCMQQYCSLCMLAVIGLPLSLCRLKACEQRRSELFAKQGRGQQFSSMGERDAWIKKVKG